MLVLEPARACEDSKREFSFGQRTLGNNLTEYASNGGQLVTEKGSLSGTEARLSISCDAWQLGGTLSLNDGHRDYTGQTSLGAPFLTITRVDVRNASADLYKQVFDSVALGLTYYQQRSDRTIVGTSLVAGYPESYDRSFLNLGARWELPSSLGLWSIAGSASLIGQQTMVLLLPGKDATPLQFDDPKQWSLSLQWRKEIGKNLFINASYGYVKTEISQSDSGIVTSGGIPVGVAYQPRMTLIDRPFLVFIGIKF